MGYCKQAYTIFFNSNQDWIDIQEMTDMLCKPKSMNRKLVVQFMKDIDADMSNTVSYDELFQAFVKNLKMDDITVGHILNELKQDFPRLGESDSFMN